MYLSLYKEIFFIHARQPWKLTLLIGDGQLLLSANINRLFHFQIKRVNELKDTGHLDYLSLNLEYSFIES